MRPIFFNFGLLTGSRVYYFVDIVGNIYSIKFPKIVF